MRFLGDCTHDENEYKNCDNTNLEKQYIEIAESDKNSFRNSEITIFRNWKLKHTGRI